MRADEADDDFRIDVRVRASLLVEFLHIMSELVLDHRVQCFRVSERWLVYENVSEEHRRKVLEYEIPAFLRYEKTCWH